MPVRPVVQYERPRDDEMVDGEYFLKIPGGHNPIIYPRTALAPMFPQTYPDGIQYPAWRMKLKDRKALVKLVPDQPFSLGQKHHHTHPLAHTTRVFAAYQALDMVLNQLDAGYAYRIHDVGGKPSFWKFHPMQAAISCSQPIVDGDDVFRRQRSPNVCGCRFPNTCPLCDNCDVYIFVHSMYYITLSEMVHFMERHPQAVIISLVHRFPDSAGSILDMQYSRSRVSGGASQIVMTAGMSAPYLHPDNDWMFDQGSERCRLGTVVWNCATEIAEHYVFRFAVTARRVQSRRPIGMARAGSVVVKSKMFPRKEFNRVLYEEAYRYFTQRSHPNEHVHEATSHLQRFARTANLEDGFDPDIIFEALTDATSHRAQVRHTLVDHVQGMDAAVRLSDDAYRPLTWSDVLWHAVTLNLKPFFYKIGPWKWLLAVPLAMCFVLLLLRTRIRRLSFIPSQITEAMLTWKLHSGGAVTKAYEFSPVSLLNTGISGITGPVVRAAMAVAKSAKLLVAPKARKPAILLGMRGAMSALALSALLAYPLSLVYGKISQCAYRHLRRRGFELPNGTHSESWYGAVCHYARTGSGKYIARRWAAESTSLFACTAVSTVVAPLAGPKAYKLCLIDPILEEKAKRCLISWFGIIGPMMFGFLEGLLANDQASDLALRAIVHTTLAYLPYGRGVFVHSLLNATGAVLSRWSLSSIAVSTTVLCFDRVLAKVKRRRWARHRRVIRELFRQRRPVPLQMASVGVCVDLPDKAYPPMYDGKFGRDTCSARSKESCIPQPGTVLWGIGFCSVYPYAVRSCIHSERSAVLFRSTWWPSPSDADLATYFDWSFAPPFSIKDVDRAKWTSELKPEKRRLYLNWPLEGFLKSEQMKKKAFIKRENYLKTLSSIKPRLIQGTYAISNYLAGPTITAHSKFLEWFVNRSSDWYLPYTASPDRMTADIEARLHFQPLHFVEMDGTRMDAAINPTFNKCLELKIPHEEGSELIMRLNRKLIGRTRHGCKYVACHGLASGVQHTAFNHCLYMWLAWRTFRSKNPSLQGQLLICNKGDDLLMFVGLTTWAVEDIVAGFQRFLEGAGLTTTCAIRGSYFSSEFLAMRPYRARNGKLLWIPKPGRLLPKLCWSSSSGKVKCPEQHAYLVSQGFKHLTAAPVIGPFMLALTRCAVFDDRDLEDVDSSWKYKMTGTSEQDREALLHEFEQFYGCSREEILELEAELDSISSLPYVCRSKLMSTFVDHDLDPIVGQAELPAGPVSLLGRTAL